MSSDELLRRANALLSEGRFAEAVAVVAPVAARAREGDDIVFAIAATLTESQALDLTGDVELALARATWAISAAHAPEHRERLSAKENAWNTTMTFLLFANAAADHEGMALEPVLRVLDEAERFLERIGKPEWRCGVQSERAALYMRFHRYDEAVLNDRAALEGKRNNPSAPGHSATSIERGLAHALTHSGRLDEATEVLQDMLSRPLKPIDALAVHTSLGQNALKRGDGALAARSADEAREIARGMSAGQRMAAAGLAVDAYLAVDCVDDARAAAEEVARCAEELGSAHAHFAARQDGFAVALRLGDRARAAELLDEMEGWAEKLDARSGTSTRMDAVRERRARLLA